MGKEDNIAEKSIAKTKLVQLIRSMEIVGSRIGEERGELGAKIKAAEADHNYDRFAGAVAFKLKKMDSGKASRHLRNIALYCDLLEIGGQADIEDAIADAKAAESDEKVGEEAMSGGLDTFEEDPVRAVANPEGELKLKTFADALRQSYDNVAIDRAVVAFVSDNPDLAARAEELGKAELARRDPTPEQKPKRRGRPKADSPAKDMASEFGYSSTAAGNA